MPCAIPALLMPKKDSSWCIFVDSHAINKITIKYKLLISWLYDILDMMVSSTIILKIDLKYMHTYMHTYMCTHTHTSIYHIASIELQCIRNIIYFTCHSQVFPSRGEIMNNNIEATFEDLWKKKKRNKYFQGQFSNFLLLVCIRLGAHCIWIFYFIRISFFYQIISLWLFLALMSNFYLF